MRETFLPFSPPSIGDEEIAEIADTLRSDWITTGPKVKRFEEEFARFLDAPAALALSSGTAAMHTALAVLGIGPGDIVVTTAMTFCSSVHVIEHVGAHPLLVDVEPETLNIDPRAVAAAIDRLRAGRLRGPSGPLDPKRLRAILPVHLYGQACDRRALGEIARAHGLALVEDAAHALPSADAGRLIGAREETPPVALVCFSFYATKNLTTAEGGMLTGPADLVDEARLWSLHGMSRDAFRRYEAEGSWFYEVVRPGFKYNMTDLQAAIGLQQLKKLPAFQARRRAIVRRYQEALAGVPALELPRERPSSSHAWHLFVIRLRAERLAGGDGSPGAARSRFIEGLKRRKIGASVHFIPVHLHPYYREKYGFAPEDFPVAYREYQRIVSLPLYPRMSDRDVEDVIEAVRAEAGGEGSA